MFGYGPSLQDQGIDPEDCIDEREPTMIRADLSFYGEFYHGSDNMPDTDGTVMRFRRRFGKEEFEKFCKDLSRLIARWDLDPYSYHRLWVLQYLPMED